MIAKARIAVSPSLRRPPLQFDHKAKHLLL